MPSLKSSLTIAALAALAWLAVGCARYAARGPGTGQTPAGEIVLGQSCALTGPTARLGLNMRAGLEACFAEVNARGGIHGRRIRLVARDDRYEPEAAAANTTRLIEQDKVLALIGVVGTPTSAVSLPLAEAAGVPFLAPFTGAGVLRGPAHTQAIHIRASYDDEMEALATYLVDQENHARIACFYQDDPYGNAGLAGITKALARRKLELVATGTYTRNTVDVAAGLAKVQAGAPDAVIIVGAYQPAAAFITQYKAAGRGNPVFCNISFVGTMELLAALGDAAEGCIISEVVTSPWDTSVPLVRDYTAALARYQPGVKPGFVSLEGYMAGRLFCMAASKVQGALTGASLLDAIRTTGRFDLGGEVLEYGPQDHEGSDSVYLAVVRGGKLVPCMTCEIPR